jgi:hypothetical protein
MASELSKKFKYTVQYSDSFGLYSRPIITTKFSLPGGERGIEVPVFALIDSGSPVTFLHSKIGKILGLNVEQGELGTFSGLGGIAVVGYQQKVAFQVAGINQVVITDVWFSDIAGTDAILGSVGFFDNFKVLLEQYDSKFEVAVKP